MLNTPSFSQEDNERLAAHAFPGTRRPRCHHIPNVRTYIANHHTGSSHNSIRQRASKLRQEHRALHEEHGWPCPDGKPAAKDTPKKAAAPKGRKRAAAATGADDDDDAGADATPATPAKKSRKAKGKAEELAAAEELAPAGDLAGVKGEADI
jgi:hypothetical protein